VFNYVNGNGSLAGAALVDDSRTAGVTFTGSYDVGMHIIRSLAGRGYPRPCIAEMGGKNACIVTANADLERAANGIVRSAFGLTGQKCSALSRLYVEDTCTDKLLDLLQQKIAALKIGDATRRENWMGPLTTPQGYANFPRYCEQLEQEGARILAGGSVLSSGDYANGYFVAPTLAEAPSAHPLFGEEMFAPIVMLSRVADREEAMRLTNDSPLGLTAGCYGSDDDLNYFFEHVEAGVTYANRPQGATTGAWPGYQPFGGWKGSGSTGKAIASFYYLALYQREQSQTRVE
jgi:1-pyrroline-5-carboxylate dehydrogenase